jgi:hypothetical protein
VEMIKGTGGFAIASGESFFCADRSPVGCSLFCPVGDGVTRSQCACINRRVRGGSNAWGPRALTAGNPRERASGTRGMEHASAHARLGGAAAHLCPRCNRPLVLFCSHRNLASIPMVFRFLNLELRITAFLSCILACWSTNE